MATEALSATSQSVIYYPGDVGQFDFSFQNTAGAYVDPTTVTVKYRLGDAGSITTLTYPTTGLTKIAVGRYRATVTLASAGTYNLQFAGTGAAGTAIGNEERYVNVQASKF